MKMRFSDLWNWKGKLDRGPYLLWGLLLFALKHNLDRYVATVGFGRPWTLFNYLYPLSAKPSVSSTASEKTFWLAMVALALPFIWAGVILTLRRLRALRWPLWSVIVFFVPVVHFLFFLLLSLLPTREDAEKPDVPGQRRTTILDRVIPHSALGSAVLAIVLAVPCGIGSIWLATMVFATYGWGLFVGLPFSLGFAAVVIYGFHQERSFGSCLAVAILATLLAGLGIIAVAMEGFICVLMAAPIAVPLAMFGGAIGYLLQRGRSNQSDFPPTLLLLLGFMPLWMGAETVSAPPAPLLQVRSEVEISASPEKVWQNVVSFSELPAPREWFFRAGVAYPIRATIHGQGVGAERHCEFSTGAFIEPIQVWDAPRLLKFSVTQNPPPMEEWTPYKKIHPPHLDGFLASQGGQFLLTPLPNGHTRLEGTTWYQHHMWPVSYWQLWSDAVIHRIHLRVLNHIKTLAEQEAKL